MSPRKRGRVTIVGALALAALVAAVSLGVAGAGAGERSAFALPRAQTFYMSGNQWAPYGDVNPAKTWEFSTGTIGLAYETAFRFNPLKGAFIPWLATSGTWRTSNVYVMNIRRGVKFSDGTTLTPGDVKYSFDLLKIPTHPQNALWASTGLKSVKVVGNTVVFTFAGKPGYQQFDFYRYNVAIVPRHVFSKYTVTELTTGNLDANQITGTGPYTYMSGASSTAQTFVWQRRSRLVGNQGVGHQAGAAVRRRHPQLVESGGARQLPGREHRSLQQLRTEIGDHGQAQDLLQQGPVSPGCEHDVALPEHDEEAAQRSSSSAALSRTRST